MAEGFQLGGARKRAQSGESWLFVLAIAAGIFAYWRYSPSAPGDWEAAATQAHKKMPRVVLFYPAWEREVLQRMKELPVVLLDGPAHLDLAGLHQVLFASDTDEPRGLVNNLYSLREWRDFAGKPFAVLQVADRSLVHDFATLEVFVEDPPGVDACPREGDAFRCRDVLVELRRAAFTQSQSRCVWVQTPAHREVTLRFPPQPTDEAFKRAALYLGAPDGHAAADANGFLRINDDVVMELALGTDKGRWRDRHTELAPGARVIELSVESAAGVCADLELSRDE